MCRSESVHKKLRQFRAGIESGISLLKRSFGLTRCTWKGFRSFKCYVLSSVVAANLLTMARKKLAFVYQRDFPLGAINRWKGAYKKSLLCAYLPGGKILNIFSQMCYLPCMEKIDARKLSTDAQQQLRYQVIRLRKQGRTFKEISAITGLNRSTCNMWWIRYQNNGKKVLKIKKRGRPTGSCRKLDKEQEKDIQKAICDKCPDQLKLPFALWTRVAVKQLIKQLWGMDVPTRTIGDYLKRWSFTPQKPLKRAYEQNPKAVQKWLVDEYPAIQQKAKKEAAEIHWGDETGLCNDSYHGRSYAPRGKTPAIRMSAQCKRVNLISTVTNQGKVRFMIYNDRMNADTFIKFMKRLIKDADRKIFLILDSLRVHHSYKARDWLQEHTHQIEVFFLSSILFTGVKS